MAQACATAGCDALHRDCSDTPTGHCTTCSSGYVQDTQSGLCRAALTCADIICGVSDAGVAEQCQPSVIDPTTPENLGREDGRGLFLMRKLMDRVERVELPHGSMVRMTLNRA